VDVQKAFPTLNYCCTFLFSSHFLVTVWNSLWGRKDAGFFCFGVDERIPSFQFSDQVKHGCLQKYNGKFTVMHLLRVICILSYSSKTA